NHLMLVDLRARNAQYTGADAEKALEQAGIITNKNAILNDPRPPKVTSGIRLGTPAVTTRGLKEGDMATVASFIDRAIAAKDDDGALEISVLGDEHEKFKTILGRMIELLSLERDIPISSYGARTLKKKRARKGAEPDESYYVQNEPKVRGRIELDPKNDPPPDL